MNYDDYLKLNDKELEKLVLHIKNIQHLRKEDTKKMLSEYDTKGLVAYLNNHDNSLQSQFYCNLDFTSLDSSHISFIEVLKTCKEWDFFKDTIFDHCSHIVFDDELLFDYFYQNHHQLLTQHIEPHAFYTNNEKVAQKLFNLKLIDLTDKNHFNIFLAKHSSAIVETAIKNNPELLDKHIYQTIYLLNISRFPVTTLNLLINVCPELKKLKLPQIITKKLEINVSESSLLENKVLEKNYYECIKSIFKINPDNLKYIFKNHPLDKDTLSSFFNVIKNTYLNEGVSDKLFLLIDHIKENQSELISELFALNKSQNPGKFKRFYEKALLVLTLETHLEEKNISTHIHKI